MYVYRNGAFSSTRGGGRSFYAGATFVAPQFQHKYIRAVTASRSLWPLCILCHCTILVRVRVTLRLAVCRKWVRFGNKPLETHDQYSFLHLNTWGYSPYVPTPLTRGWVCCLQLILNLASAVILGSVYRGTRDHILLSEIRDYPNLQGQIPVFISPRIRVARLYPHAMGSLFVASYDSHGYGGGIRTRFRTGLYYTKSEYCLFWTST
jgi:hypothetical protein